MPDTRRRAAQYGLWALADQGVISLGTFLTNVLLARGVPQKDYGIYGIVLSGLLFLNGVHSSLIAYPLSVRGAVQDQEGLRRCAGTAIALNVALSALLMVPLFAAVALFAGARVASLAAAALFFWQLQETLRRSLLAGTRHCQAIWGDSASFVGQAVLLGLLSLRRPLSLEIALGAMAATSAVAAALQAVQVRPQLTGASDARRDARPFWALGRLILASSVLNLLTINGYFWVLAVRFGFEKTAALRAVMNLLGVSHPLLFSFGNVIVPAAAKARVQGGPPAAWRCAWRHTVPAGLLLFPFLAALAISPAGFLRMFYGRESAYLNLGTAVQLAALAYAFAFAAQALKAFLAGLGNTGAIFAVQLSAAACSVAAGLPLAAWLGVNGACAGLLAVNVSTVAASLFYVALRMPGISPWRLAGIRDGRPASST